MNSFPKCRKTILGAALASATALSGPAAQQVDATPEMAAIALPMMQLPLQVMVELVAGWVAANLGVPMPEALPGVAFADPGTIAAIRHSAEGAPGAASAETDMVAIYDTRSQTIFLPLGWTGRSAAEVSILVHETVHHFQQVAADRFACPAEREKMAYAVQARWLEAHGGSLQAAFGIDPAYVLVATTCMF